MKRVLFLSLLAFAASAQVVPDQYIVELSNEPVARMAARQHKRLLRSDPELASHRTRIQQEQSRMRSTIESGGAEVLDSFQTVHNGLVVHMSRERANAVAAMAGVKAVRPVRMYQKLLDRSLPLQKVNDAWQQIGGVDKAGLGVKIAIIDTGVDSTHPAFQDAGFAMPDGFPKVNRASDTVYTNNRVIVARGYSTSSTSRTANARDVDGHGTGVAMVAAGGTNNGTFGPITGVAPKAFIGNYKVFPDGGTGAPDSLIIRALEDAVDDGMDVMNLSLGGFPAARPADDSLVQAVEAAVAAGKIVTIASGNDGGVPNTIGSPGTAPSAISVGSTNNDRIFAGHVTEDGHDPFTAIPGDGKNPTAPVSGSITDIAGVDPTGLACSSLPAGSLSGAVALILRGTCNFSVKLQNALDAGAIAAVIYARPESPDPISMATGGINLPAVMVSNGDGSVLKQDAGSNPKVAVDFNPTPAAVNPAVLSGYSSVGPNSDSGIKPDMLAVGANISTAEPVSQGSYVVESGTSFSSPTVAGAAALLISARPGLKGAQYRSLLVNSASTFSTDGTNPLRVQSAGAGLLNMSAALANNATSAPVSLSFGMGGGTVDWTKTLTITNVGSAPDTFAISVQPIGDGTAPTVSTNTLQLAAGQSQDISVRFAGDGLAGGAFQGYVQIQGTQSTVTGRVPYWYAVPTQAPQYFQVLLSPTSVRRSATFDVEFRVLDVNGVPVTSGIDNSIVSGADVVGIESSDVDIPGSFVAHLKAPATRGALTLQFTIGNTGSPVSITVN